MPGHVPSATEPTSYQLAILGGLQRKLVYLGTVDPEIIRQRRVKNRVARKSRRINRLRGGK